jgi:hypothetical protein
MKTREERWAEEEKWRSRHVSQLSLLSTVIRSEGYQLIRKKKVTPESLQEACKAGVLLKRDLEHGKYYFGQCRNAHVARWDADRQCFTYIREKFDHRFPEDIKHPEDDNGFDFFSPVCQVEPEEQEVIE